MKPALFVQPAKEDDMPRCMELLIPSFEFMSISDILNGPNTTDNRRALGQAHWQTFRDHEAKYSRFPVGIKCVHTDHLTGEQRIVGYAEWYLYDKPQTTADQQDIFRFVASPYSRDEEDKERVQRYFSPSVAARNEIMGGRSYGLLLWLCVDPEFRRRGVASMIVQSGLERCAELGIPAYLEASEQGKHLYERLGWEVLDHPKSKELGYPIMTWRPDSQSRQF